MTNENDIQYAIMTLFAGEMTEQGLAELRKRFPKDIVHDMTDEKQFKSGRKVRTELNKLTKAIKDRRLSVTGEIKTKADDLTNEVELIFATVVGPFETQLEVNKKAKEKAERELKELLGGQRVEISNMNNFVTECIGKTSKYISDVIEAVDLIDTTYFHKEIIHEAIEVKKAVESRLAELLTQALNEETLQEERAKLLKQQEAAAAAQLIIDLKAKAQERLNKLMMIPTGFFGKTSKEINTKIESLKNFEVLESEFGELFNQANSSKTQVINQLEMMANQQETVEQAQAQVEQSKPEAVDQVELKSKIATERATLPYADSAQARGNQQRNIDRLVSQLEPEQNNVELGSMAEVMAKNAPTIAETKTVRGFLTEYNKANGYGVDDECLIETLTESKRVHTDSYIDMHRWYGIQSVVNEIDGVFIMFSDYIITGDNGMADMDLSHNLDGMVIVHRKERTVIEVYYA
jgi:hypothetical protein